MIDTTMDFATFERRAAQVAALLTTIGNPRRLMLLCKLAEHGELTAGALGQEIALSQSACSQHLGKLRDEGLVAFRRDGQALWYRIADPRTEALLARLYDLYCKD